MTAPAPALWLLDMPALFFRAWFGLPPGWEDGQGRSRHGVVGMCRTLGNWLLAARPERCAGAFDRSFGSGFRHQCYAGYKQNRAAPDDDIRHQLDLAEALCPLLGVSCWSSKVYEADDILATLAYRQDPGAATVGVLTRDKDLLQLLRSPGDLWQDFVTGQVRDDAWCRDELGVPASRLAELQALTGDTADNIPGVPGVGPRHAARLLSAHGTLDALYAALDAGWQPDWRGGARLVEPLLVCREQVQMALMLTRLVQDVPLPETGSLHWHGPDLPALRRWLDEQALRRPLEKTLRQLEASFG